ncbi:restriction endonuclease subunit S [Legionella pneumophila serogroup 1]
MELKEDYNNTKLGLLPKDWKWNILPNVLENGADSIKIGPFGSALKKEILVKSGYKVYGQENIFNKNMEIGTRYINFENFKKLKNCELKTGDIIISMMGTIGQCHIIPEHVERGIMDSHLLRLRLDQYSIDPIFFIYFFESNLLLAQIKKLSVGGIMDGLSSKIIKNLCIITPPKKEQAAIAKALSDADAWIQSLTQLIAKKRQIKQGAMQTLLNPFENGKLKDGWEERYLDEIADVIDPHPSHRAPPIDRSGIPFIGIGDIDENGDIKNSGLRLVSKSVLNEHRTRYQLGDRLIGLGRVASIGKVVKLKNTLDDYVISPTLGVIKGKSVPPEYLFYILNSKFIKEQFNKIMSGSTRSSVGMNVLRKLKVPIIEPATKQIEILKFLNDIDEEIKLLESKLNKAKQIKQGMMQNLLTGRIRLI